MENVAIAKCAITGLPLFHSVLSFVVIRSQPWGLGLNDPCVCVCVFGDVLPRAGCVWHCTVEVQVCGSRRKPPCFSLPLLLLHLLLLLLLWTIFVFLERRSFKKKKQTTKIWDHSSAQAAKMMTHIFCFFVVFFYFHCAAAHCLCPPGQCTACIVSCNLCAC